jgi:hypothetical protein
MEAFSVGLGCTGRYLEVMEGFRLGLGCTGRYMDVMEGSMVIKTETLKTRALSNALNWKYICGLSLIYYQI